MLLLHQTGSVKIGEIVRYTVTYKPSADHILPSPEFLYLRIKNTCAIPLRAAFVHGPYTLSVSAYPSVFKPFEKFENPRRYGVPEFEPMLKPGAVWNCHLVVPDTIRQTAGEGSSKHGHFGGGPQHDDDAVSWVIEVASQVIFSASASVHYEVLLARDEKSLNLGSVVPVIGGQAHVPQPGRVSDFQHAAGAAHHHSSSPKGVFSKAVHLKVEDTAALWDTPHLPGWDDMGWLRAREHQDADVPVEPSAGTTTGTTPGTTTEGGNPQEARRQPKKRQKKVHLVVLTHGLHSNLGGDMLFLKESIDAAVKQAKVDAKARRAKERAARNAPVSEDIGLGVGSETNPVSGPEQQTDPSHGQDAQDEGEHGAADEDDDDDDEEVIVRGFSGNATKTERGIKYLGKRLARYILSMTYPDQPCLPTAKAASEAIAHSLKTSSQKKAADEVHKHSSIRHPPPPAGARLYKFTKISFIAHSLGGPVQTYAVAYIQKHSPQFFDLIEPVNFIAMASPFLGLNHENPLYVKFALDFGLVGRTGQDLGLTWRAPTIARNGWGALVSNLGEHAQKRVYGEPQPESKPLLRILPTGPAHKALKKFRNRTVYSNVVNDGIVPLRTSCLLFLDWQGLGRVEKARREAGLVETVVGFGWAELTGATVTTPRLSPWSPVEPEGKDEPYSTGETTPTGVENSHEVPQPPTNAMLEDDRQSLRSLTSPFHETTTAGLQTLQSGTTTTSNPFSSFFTFFRSEAPKPPPPPSPKVSKIYRRSQTIRFDSESTSDSTASSKSKVTAGNELTDEQESNLSAPPRTTIFESAGDLLNPKLPPVEFLIDPSKRPRTIFHDRVYHPADIPPPPLKQRSASPLNLRRRTASAMSSSQKSAKSETPSPPPTQQSNASSASKQTVGSAGGGDESTVHTPSFDKDRPAGGSSRDDAPDPDVDMSQIRVEEKIARAYHRGLSWRKVLVKLEPDAHNNIVVRRTFANAFGWPVVQHLVESHFSDSATARLRDADEPNVERSMPLRRKPGPAGGETEPGGVGSDAHGLRVSIDNGGGGVGAEDARGEEGDTLSPLPLSPGLVPGYQLGMAGSGTASPTTPRIGLDRRDSVTWSERDWMDSGDESDDAVGSSGKPARKEAAEGKGKGVIAAAAGLGVGAAAAAQPGERSASPLMWSWTEKIVGRGAAGRSKSPGAGGPDAGGKK